MKPVRRLVTTLALALAVLVCAAPAVVLGASKSSRPTLVVDFDDTLVRTQPLYDRAKKKLQALAKSAGLDPQKTLATFNALQKERMKTLGFSRERFPSSMRDAVKKLGGSAKLQQQAYEIGNAVFETRAHNYPHAEALLSTLKHQGWNVIVLTKGDPDVQRARVFGSSLVDYVDAVEIVKDKSARTFRSLFRKYNVDSGKVWVAGNSLRSDVLPAIDAGVAPERAIWLSARGSWAHELAGNAKLPASGRTAKSLAEAGKLLGLPRLKKYARPRRDLPRDPLLRDIARVLTADLLKPRYAAMPMAGAHYTTGHCYLAVESLYHLKGGAKSGLKPQTIQHEGGPHWFARDLSDKVHDPTAAQFATPVNYANGRGCGFLTGDKPSARTREVMLRVQALRKYGRRRR
ncbi:MAG: HAD family hydrolase [Myxococcales bacterium]|nr:HAD family hydrolase [Myxococcales bacterium]